MFKIRARYGWAFNAMLCLSVFLFLKSTMPEKAAGYQPAQLSFMDSKFAAAEIEGGGIPRISVADLPGDLDDNDGR